MYYRLGPGKRFGGSNLCLFAAHSNLNVYPQSFAGTPTLMFAHVHFYNFNVWLILGTCSRKVEAVMANTSLLFIKLVTTLNSCTFNFLYSNHSAVLTVLRASCA